jgi:hypothetical protein
MDRQQFSATKPDDAFLMGAHRAITSELLAARQKPSCQPEAPKQQMLRFPAGTFAVINASNNYRELADSRTSKDITLTALPSARGRVEIYGLDQTGRLRAGGETALVRVTTEGAQVCLGYEFWETRDGDAPDIVVRKVSASSRGGTSKQLPITNNNSPDISAGNVQVHFHGRGDVSGQLGAWLRGQDASLGVEGFALRPWDGLSDSDVMYQAIFGARWESRWFSGGEYCGTRDMDFPINGFRIKLSEAAAAIYRLNYTGLFSDGSVVGPIDCGEACASADYLPLIGLRLTVDKR